MTAAEYVRFTQETVDHIETLLSIFSSDLLRMIDSEKEAAQLKERRRRQVDLDENGTSIFTGHELVMEVAALKESIKRLFEPKGHIHSKFYPPSS